MDMYKRIMSRAGTPTDNAAMESINGWIKTELSVEFHLEDKTDVPKSVARYVQFFNEERLAYSLGYPCGICFPSPCGCRLSDR